MKTIVFALALLCILFTTGTTAQTITGVVNAYTAISSYDSQCGCLNVSSVKGFAKGDRVMIIQMQGASVNSSMTPLFGSVNNYGQAGKFEFSSIATINGNSISLLTQLANQYDFQNGSVQLVKVVTGADVVTTGVVSAKDWDGSTGGVIVIEASNSIIINGTIDASAKGFRGGESSLGNYTCGQHFFAYNSASRDGGSKGEGIAKADAQVSRGRGAWANGGGGGNNHNAGGGGGANAWSGGFGGYAWGNCAIKNDVETRGIGGYGLNYTSLDTRAYMGGGGGAGHRNDNNPSSGANGGGIIILVAQNLTVVNGAIISRGGDAAKTEMDGAGGGGAGGTVALFCENIANNLNIDVRGGNGGDARSPHGPGGGGSAGVVMLKQDQMPSMLSVVNQGGRSGMNYELGAAAIGFVKNAYGSTDGENGVILSSVRLPLQGASNNPVRVIVDDNKTICKGTALQLKTLVQGGSNNYSYIWSPSTGLSDSTIGNPIARPTKTTTYIVSVRDSRGCIDSDTMTVVVGAEAALELGNDRSICKGSDVQLDTWVSGGSGVWQYQWSPATGLSNPTVQNPIATPLQTTTYTLTISDVTTGCSVRDSITINVRTMETPVLKGDSIVCAGSTHTYVVESSTKTPFLWAVSGAKDMVMQQNGTSAVVTWGQGGMGKVCVSGDMSNNSCVALVKMNVTIVPEHKPLISAHASTTICEGDSISIEPDMDYAEYHWSNGATTPTIRVGTSGVYSLRTISYSGCEAISNTIEIHVVEMPNVRINITGNTKPCSGESVTLDAGEWASYHWSNGAVTRTITPEQSGEYTVQVSNSNGCTAVSPAVRINRGGVVQPAIKGNALVCEGTLQMYYAVGMPGSSFSWQILGARDVNYFNVMNDSVAVLWGDATKATIHVTEITSDGCQGSNKSYVDVQPHVNVKILASATELFDGSTITLDAGDGFASYSWSTGATTRSIIVSQAGDYTVSVTTTAGCTATSAAVHISNVANPSPKVVGSNSFCEGESITLSAENAEGDILWSTGSTSRSILVSTPGKYYYTLITTNNHSYTSDTLSVRMIQNPKPTVHVVNRELVSSVGSKYQWLLNGMTIAGATEASYTPSASGKYSVVVSNAGGCTNVSDQFAWRLTATVHVSLPRVSAKPGERVILSLRAQTAHEGESIEGRFSALISFSSALLYPAGATPIGNVENGKRYIRLEGVVGENGILAAMEFLALQGEGTATSLTIEEVIFGANADITIENGEFTLEPVCGLSGNKAVSFGQTLNLKQNYPNPFSETTTIEYTLLENGQTTLSVTDMQGKTVATIYNGLATRGSYTQSYNAHALPSGEYILRLVTPNNTVSRVMVIQH